MERFPTFVKNIFLAGARKVIVIHDCLSPLQWSALGLRRLCYDRIELVFVVFISRLCITDHLLRLI